MSDDASTLPCPLHRLDGRPLTLMVAPWFKLPVLLSARYGSNDAHCGHVNTRTLRILPLVLVMVAGSAMAQDAARGEKLYRQRCSSCHAVDENGAGPRTRTLFGRKAGTQAGFNYSDALRLAGFTWNDRTLDRWLANPNSMVPGNDMIVQMANEPADRLDIIAWLRASTLPVSVASNP